MKMAPGSALLVAVVLVAVAVVLLGDAEGADVQLPLQLLHDDHEPSEQPNDQNQNGRDQQPPSGRWGDPRQADQGDVRQQPLLHDGKRHPCHGEEDHLRSKVEKQQAGDQPHLPRCQLHQRRIPGCQERVQHQNWQQVLDTGRTRAAPFRNCVPDNLPQADDHQSAHEDDPGLEDDSFHAHVKKLHMSGGRGVDGLRPNHCRPERHQHQHHLCLCDPHWAIRCSKHPGVVLLPLSHEESRLQGRHAEETPGGGARQEDHRGSCMLGDASEAVAAVIEELPERRGGGRSARLLSIQSIHGLVEVQHQGHAQ
mmetsp:Transcript_72367/g.172848  ORF Transcript_72367/g.172848 Transcript_72367/m.172848 type:complete len:310 (-) Transcript_72367:277-1206(-)